MDGWMNGCEITWEGKGEVEWRGRPGMGRWCVECMERCAVGCGAGRGREGRMDTMMVDILQEYTRDGVRKYGKCGKCGKGGGKVFSDSSDGCLLSRSYVLSCLVLFSWVFYLIIGFDCEKVRALGKVIARELLRRIFIISISCLTSTALTKMM
jgi:hypothetical protein